MNRNRRDQHAATFGRYVYITNAMHITTGPHRGGLLWAENVPRPGARTPKGRRPDVTKAAQWWTPKP